MVQVSGGQLITSSGQPIMVQAMSGGQGQTIMQVPVSGAQGLQQVIGNAQIMILNHEFVFKCKFGLIFKVVNIKPLMMTFSLLWLLLT